VKYEYEVITLVSSKIMTPCSLVVEIRLMVGKAGFSETSVNFYQNTRRHIPKESTVGFSDTVYV